MPVLDSVGGFGVRIKPWQGLAMVAAVCFGFVYLLHEFQSGAIQTDADLLALLPQGGSTVLYADLVVLRQAGVLKLLSPVKTTEDPEYQDFVRQTGFDYSRDAEAVVAALADAQVFFVVRGKFDWRRLRQYADSHGGACRGNLCYAPTSKPSRWASFFPVQSNVMGLAVSEDQTAAYALSPRRDRLPARMPVEAPVWISVGQSALQNTSAIPPALQVFAGPLMQAGKVLLSIGGSPRAWTIELDAECGSEGKAEILRGRLEARTQLLKSSLARQHEQPSPADLTGLVAEGRFERNGSHVTGSWPLHRELLNSLE